MNKSGGAQTPPFIYRDMNNMNEYIVLAKYAVGIIIVIGIILAPAWLARQTGKGKVPMMTVRLASWIFGWSIIGWLYALFCASKK